MKIVGSGTACSQLVVYLLFGTACTTNIDNQRVPCEPSCGAGEICDETAGVCRSACERNADCPVGEECVAATICLPPTSIERCDDENLCTEGDSVVGGACVGVPIVCVAGSGDASVCDPETGTCTVTSPVETKCGDGNDNDGDGEVDCDDTDCLVAEPCLEPCDDGGDCPAADDCREFACVSGTCKPTINEGDGCDADLCSLNGTCDANGICQGFELEEPNTDACDFNPNNECRAAICVEVDGAKGCDEGDVAALDGMPCADGRGTCDAGGCFLDAEARCDDAPGYAECPQGSSCNENYDGNGAFCVSDPTSCAYVENLGQASQQYQEVSSGDRECSLTGANDKSKLCSAGTWGGATCATGACGSACNSGATSTIYECGTGSQRANIYEVEQSCSSSCDIVETQSYFDDCGAYGCQSGTTCHSSCSPGSEPWTCAPGVACNGSICDPFT